MSECSPEILLDNLVVGADGDSREVDIPDGVVGAGDGGDGGVLLPLGVDWPDHVPAQEEAPDGKHKPYYPALGIFRYSRTNFGLRVTVWQIICSSTPNEVDGENNNHCSFPQVHIRRSPMW